MAFTETISKELEAQMTLWRRDLHKHAELAFEEVRTAAFVAKELRSYGLEVHEGIGQTGVVGVLRAGSGSRAIGLRADMDALAMTETTGKPWASIHEGRFHGCGHDGHTAMLLGAAKVLSDARGFEGTVYFIFQPAEENEGGATAMIADGLFQRFPMERVFGLHNWPSLPAGEFAVRAGPLMAAFGKFDIELTGTGGHAAIPHDNWDPIPAQAAIVQALQTIVSRNIDPIDPAVLSITQVHAGTTYNVTPEKATIAGCVRYFSEAAGAALASRIKTIAEDVAKAHGVRAEVRQEEVYIALVNEAEATDLSVASAAALVGADKVNAAIDPVMTSEDFAFMLREMPGCYILMGTAEPGAPGRLHDPNYDFNDRTLGLGAAYWVQLVGDLLGAE